jgi:hypothetical protein
MQKQKPKAVNARNINMFSAAASCVLWGIATYTDWVAATRFISHISMANLVITFVAAWRADVPTKEGA